jgi:transposase
MDKAITFFVGLDVHKETIAIGVAVGDEAPRFVGTVGPQLSSLLTTLGRIGPPSSLRLVYEAGPTGFHLARELVGRGYDCRVIAAAKIPRRPGERIKTDRRDCQMLARLARAGELVAVVVPDVRDEAIRDLSRAREDAVAARLKARQQLKAMLLRHGHRYSGKTSWTPAHERYLAAVSFAHPAQDLAFAEYRLAVSGADAQVTRLTAALRTQVETWRMQPVVAALCTLRGIDFVAAVTLLAELGDLTRFAHPRELMGFLGLVPAQYSSGETRRHGAITKTGNAHARRVLVEAALNHRFPARMSRLLQQRQTGQPEAVRAIAWKAQTRLCHRYRRLVERSLPKNKASVAIARELAGFVWDIARHVQPTR